MARAKHSNLYCSVEGKLSIAMTVIYKHDLGQPLSKAEIQHALVGLELASLEIKKNLLEVCNEDVS